MHDEPKRTAAGDSPVVAVASLICNRGAAPYGYVIQLLSDIDAKFPDLSFSDFVLAVRLSDFASRMPWGAA